MEIQSIPTMYKPSGQKLRVGNEEEREKALWALSFSSFMLKKSKYCAILMNE